jgi:hypothetical protein
MSMKKLIVLPLIAAAALGLSACAKHADADNIVSGNDIAVNSGDDLALNSEDANASVDAVTNDSAETANTAGN